MTDFGAGEGELLPASPLRKRGPQGPGQGSAASGSTAPEPGDVGDFRQGSAQVRWALARYLVGRVIISRVSGGLLFTAGLIAVLGALVFWLGVHWLGVLVILFAIGVLFVRWVFVSIVRRLTLSAELGRAEGQLRRLVGDTGGDFRKEMRRIGVPMSWWSFPILLIRLLRGRSRRVLFERMRSFDLRRTVPDSRVDELHMLIASVTRGGRPIA
jgi:hypothetical protein